MDLSYPAETEPLRAEIRQWLVDNLPDGWGRPGFALSKDEKKAFNRDWVKKLYDGGWICASWPKEYGGKGLSLMESVVLNEEFARAEAPLRADFFGDTLVGPTILQWATEEQKQQFIPGILKGTIAWCQGFSEPDAGSDLASLKTRAELDGDEWVINGQKVWTSFATTADYGMLVARTDWDLPKHRGISFFMLPMRQPGIEIRPIHQITGESEFNEIFIDDARVPTENLVGELNAGWSVLQTALAYERRFMGDLARTAKDNRRPRAEKTNVLIELARDAGRLSDPYIRQQIARVDALATVNRWNTQRSKAAVDRGEAATLMALGKIAMSRILHETARVETEIVGAEAMLAGPDNPVGDAVTFRTMNAYFTSIGGGTDQIQRNIIGERVLGLPKEPEPYRNTPFRDLPH